MDRYQAKPLRDLLMKLFESFDVPAEDAAIAADALVTADIYGIDSHGSGRLFYYVNKLRDGLINPHPRVRILRDSPIGFLIDGDNGLGHPVARFAMQCCIERARESGGACATVGRSNHYGIAGYYSLLAAPHGMIGVSLTNGAPIVVPTFGKEKMLGANPISVAVPTGGKWPFLLDMSTSVVAAGKLQLAMMDNDPIPPGWAIDPEGRPTTDPITGLDGGLLPLGSTRETGSHKGYGLAVLVDILSALLSGAAFGPQCGGLTREFSEVSNVGHFFAAVRIDAFLPLKEFKQRMDTMIEGLKQSALAPEEKRIFIHGEPEFEEAERRRVEGIPLHPTVVEFIRTIAKERGLDESLEALLGGGGT